MSMSELSEGNVAVARNKDGSETDGEVVAVHDTTVGEFTAEWMDSGETLADYWSTEYSDVTANEQTVTVDVGDAELTYPISRVEVADD